MDLLSGSTRKTILISFVLCSVLLLRPALHALGQETQYTPEEYAAYQAITGETDIAKKSDLITQFFKTYPKSTLKQHVVADFQLALFDCGVMDMEIAHPLLHVGDRSLAAGGRARVVVRGNCASGREQRGEEEPLGEQVFHRSSSKTRRRRDRLTGIVAHTSVVRALTSMRFVSKL